MLSESQLQEEWDYIYNERLAILGWFNPNLKPPDELHKLAKDDADKAVEKLEKKQ